jgi:flagellin-specific chaperone FliS
MPNQQAAIHTYRANQVNSASPLDLVLMAYDAALVGCGQRDLIRTTRALSALRNALDFSYDADTAMGLFRLYQYCADLARSGDYDTAADLLRELRNTWALVTRQSQECGVTAPQPTQHAYTAPVTSRSYTTTSQSMQSLVTTA